MVEMCRSRGDTIPRSVSRPHWKVQARVVGLMGFTMISITAEGIEAGRTERKSRSAVTEAGATCVTRGVNPVRVRLLHLNKTG